MHFAANEIIKHYNLQPHPEGGFYKEVYRSKESIAANALPERFTGDRNFSTAIYFLLEQGNFSAFHKIKSDECWHFYAGGCLEIFMIDETGNLDTIKLGSNFLNKENFQFVVPANCWFASTPAAGVSFAFVGCTVSPAFDFADFELAKRDELIKLYPQHKSIITKLTQ